MSDETDHEQAEREMLGVADEIDEREQRRRRNRLMRIANALSTVLEDQMAELTSDFDRSSAGYSPDRFDALVWALTELSEGAGD